MEPAGISVEAGSPDQLDPAYQLDFDPNAGLVLEDFDYAPFAQDEHIFTEDTAEDAGVPNPDTTPGDVDQEADAGIAVKPDQTADVTQEIGHDAEPQAEYQDEIGYEDDDLVNTSPNADLGIAEAGETEAGETQVGETEVGLSNAMPEDHLDLEPAQFADGNHAEALAHDEDASWDEDINFEEHSESVNPQDEPVVAAEEELAEEDAAIHPDDNDLTVADFNDETAHEQFAAGHHDDELEEALDDLSHSLADAPDLEVLYNEDCYSLFGTLDDDPESYFLSDVEELDRPLSHFLSALRAVISDEIAPTDEVVIRFDPLDLEFGERSNEKFLNRSFREIIDCHATLSRVRGIPADPVIHLAVRPDSEEHFLELLSEAELGKGHPHSAEDSEMSENMDEVSPADDLDAGQTQDEPFEAGNSEVHGEGGHAATDRVEDENGSELETAPGEDNVAEEQEQNLQVGASASQRPDIAIEALEGEGLSEDILAATHPYEVAEDAAHEEKTWEEEAGEGDGGEEQAWDEQAAEDDRTAPQHAEISLEVLDEETHQPIEQQDGNELVEATDFSAVDEAPAHENGTHEQEAGSNDDDLILAFDEDHDVPTIREEGDEYEEYSLTYDASENTADGAVRLDTAETTTESLRKDSENGVHVAAATETASVHTSTTLNGDEIDYDEENGAVESFTPNPNAQQLGAASGMDNDEIDWENDEDEHEQQPASGDDAAEYESKEAALTPPSVAGKRSRTDEAESLAAETDHKRRRT